MTPDTTNKEGRDELRRRCKHVGELMAGPIEELVKPSNANAVGEFPSLAYRHLPAALDIIDQQAAEISRLREEATAPCPKDTDLDGDCHLCRPGSGFASRRKVEGCENGRIPAKSEITRLRTAIVEARRQVEVIAIELSNDYAKYAEQLADKLAATLADALRETT